MTDPAAYLDALGTRREEVARLHELIRAALPELEVEAGATGLGYGPYRYRYASGREGESFRVSVASRKGGISLYVQSAIDGEYLAPRYAGRLSKASIGKSCLKFKRLDDLDPDALTELLHEAGRHPPMDAIP